MVEREWWEDQWGATMVLSDGWEGARQLCVLELAEALGLSDELDIVAEGKGAPLFILGALKDIQKGICVGTIDWMFVSPQNSYVKILTFNTVGRIRLV